jgi:hypothetical protein
MMEKEIFNESEFATANEKSPDQEILEQKGGIFSCGGVYISQAEAPEFKGHPHQFLHLPHHQKGVMVLKGYEIFRRPDFSDEFSEPKVPEEEVSSQDALRRLFKEGLN